MIVNPPQQQIVSNSFQPQTFIKKWRDDFSGDALSSDWEVLSLGNGQSIDVNNSELSINAGTTSNAQTIIRSKKKFTIPCRVFFIAQLSARIQNQEFIVEVIDLAESHFARFVFNGTSGVTVLHFHGNSKSTGSSGSLNLNVTTISHSLYEFDIGIDELKFCTKNIDSSSYRNVNSRNRRIPDPNIEYFIQIRVTNSSTPPSSNTLFKLDSISYQSYELIATDVSTSRPSQNINESIPSIITNTVSVNGNVTIVDGGNFSTVTTNPLSANGNYVSGGQSASGRNSITITVRTDQPGTFYFEQSQDNANWFDYGSRNCIAGINTFNFSLDILYYRVRYVNGSTATGTFAIYIKLRT